MPSYQIEVSKKVKKALSTMGNIPRARKSRHERIAVIPPYEACDGEVGWTVQEVDDDGETLGTVIAECESKGHAEHLLRWIENDRKGGF